MPNRHKLGTIISLEIEMSENWSHQKKFRYSENSENCHSVYSQNTTISLDYRKIPSSNTSRLEAHVGFFRLLMKGIFGPYVL